MNFNKLEGLLNFDFNEEKNKWHQEHDQLIALLDVFEQLDFAEKAFSSKMKECDSAINSLIGSIEGKRTRKPTALESFVVAFAVKHNWPHWKVAWDYCVRDSESEEINVILSIEESRDNDKWEDRVVYLANKGSKGKKESSVKRRTFEKSYLKWRLEWTEKKLNKFLI